MMENIQIKTEPVDYADEGYMSLLPDWYPSLQSTATIPVTVVTSHHLVTDLPSFENFSKQSIVIGQGCSKSLSMVTAHDTSMEISSCHLVKTEGPVDFEPVELVTSINEKLVHNSQESNCQNLDIGHRKSEPLTIRNFHLNSSDDDKRDETLCNNLENDQGHPTPGDIGVEHTFEEYPVEHFKKSASEHVNQVKPTVEQVEEPTFGHLKHSEDLPFKQVEESTFEQSAVKFIKESAGQMLDSPVQDQIKQNSDNCASSSGLCLPCKQEPVEHVEDETNAPFPVGVYKLDDKSKSLVELPDGASCDLEKFSRTYYSNEAQMEIKFYQCPTCSSLLVSKHALQNHLRIHSGVKPFQCPLCDFKCIQKGNYNRHLQIHSGEKPYKCPLCDYSCVNKTRLDKHMLVHSDVKPFKCPLCDYKFKRRDQVKVHLKTHYKGDKYRCPACEFSAKSLDSLYVHIVSHSEENT